MDASGNCVSQNGRSQVLRFSRFTPKASDPVCDDDRQSTPPFSFCLRRNDEKCTLCGAILLAALFERRAAKHCQSRFDGRHTCIPNGLGRPPSRCPGRIRLPADSGPWWNEAAFPLTRQTGEPPSNYESLSVSSSCRHRESWSLVWTALDRTLRNLAMGFRWCRGLGHPSHVAIPH